MAKGIDIGTCFLVGATPTDSSGLADVSIRSIRDAFLDVENEAATKNMLKMSKVPYIEKGDMLYIVGDPALRIANMLKKEVRRPLSKGVIAAGEKDWLRSGISIISTSLSPPAVHWPAKLLSKNARNSS